MTDKELIKEEIEKQIDYAEDDTRYTESYREGLIAAYQTIKAFIDSLPEEPASEDLEEEFYRFIDEEEGIHKICNTRECIAWGVDIASHFTEWQEKKMLGIAEAFYQQGRYEQEQEMMKDAVELHIVESFNPVGTENEKLHGFTALYYNAKYPDFYPVTGQTIKVIPTKEIQQ